MLKKDIISIGWVHIGGDVYSYDDEYYLFKDLLPDKWSIYEKESDCLNRDENFCLAHFFTIRSIDELKLVMKMTDIISD